MEHIKGTKSEKNAPLAKRSLKQETSRLKANCWIFSIIQNRYRVHNDHERPNPWLFPSGSLCNQDKAVELVKWEAIVGQVLSMRILLLLYCIEMPPDTLPRTIKLLLVKTKSFTSILCAAIKHSPYWVLKEWSLVSGLSQTQDGCLERFMPSAVGRRSWTRRSLVGSDAQNNKLFEFKHSRNVTAPHAKGETETNVKFYTDMWNNIQVKLNVKR